MQFGKAIGTACASFAITNIDDAFVLVTFFAEASTRKNATLTPLKITIGQYLGFTVIVVISMIGFGVSLVLPSEPIGFLGLLPMLLGVWALIGLIFGGDDDDDEDDDVEDGDAADGEAGEGGREEAVEGDGGRGNIRSRLGSFKGIFKVGSMTVINGGDNIGTYIPLFSQAKGAEIAVYVVVYYILLGVWCLAAWLVMKQRHILKLAQKYAEYVVPFLYMGLGIYIVVKSDAYPWSIERIDGDIDSHPGKLVMAVSTTGLLLLCIGGMGFLQWWKWKKEKKNTSDETGAERLDSPSIDDDGLSRRTEVEPPFDDEIKTAVQTPASENDSHTRRVGDVT
ncbi:Cadmium resistance transporter [Penicillium cosmopolitanum]|uniref:Cadmium resistance transporter n=1 Tax=Penicillium cosmopolitanum TaxID=1131564 RepID=A0A9X0BAB0_9EURO|nr:Cadmium resistance transporter [Penicillium cosmopolitanum]KAJ5397575.1 Cadmium resistance transporter [Penicillium cosmopolitanum]